MEIGEERLFRAVLALVSSEGDVRARVVIAARILQPLDASGQLQDEQVKKRLNDLLAVLAADGGNPINYPPGDDKFSITADKRKNRSYVKHAKEIFDLWQLTLPTCDDSGFLSDQLHR